MQDYMKNKLTELGVIGFGLLLILFTQSVKLIKNPDSTPVTWKTFAGLVVLGLFAFLGVLFADLMKMTGIKILASFPVLGWVSIISLIFCLCSNFFVDMIGGVDFMSITTPVLTFAGISVANNIKELSKSSWKYLILAIFVFLGSYLFRVIFAALGLLIAG